MQYKEVASDGVAMARDILRKLERCAAQSRSRVGIGVGNANSALMRGVAKAGRFADVVLVGEVEQAGRDVVKTTEPEQKLVEMLVDGAIDAAVRGTLSARKTLQHLKLQIGARQMGRSALLSTSAGKQFFLLPVGIDEGTSTTARAHLVTETAHLLTALNVRPKIGVLSGGRSEDKGRTEAVDRTIASAEALTEQLCGAGLDATNYDILIEDATESSNILVALDGVNGNLIFRTLVFLGGGTGHGAPFFGIPYTFVDTSRSGAAFGDAIIVACALSNLAQA
jgi:putative methanogen marker protein 4